MKSSDLLAEVRRITRLPVGWCKFQDLELLLLM